MSAPDSASSSSSPKRVGPYSIEDELGRGGMGVVYRARDPGGAQVAIKLLLGAAARQKRAQGRFEREIAALRRLHHPNLVELRDAGRHGEHRYLVMEYLAGPSLQQRLEAEGPLPQEEVGRIGLALAEALAYVHRQGVIHRDLKPENVLFDAEGVPRLTDFGLVREVAGDQTRLTKTGMFLGSPGYWAPEQAQGDVHGLGPWTDVYGLGALLYALLVGRAPHEGGTLMEAMAAVARDPTPPSKLRPGVDSQLEQIVLRCMARAPEARFRSALGVASSLEGWLLDPEAQGRRGLWVAALGGVAVLLLAVLAVVLVQRGRAPAVPSASSLSSPEAPPTQAPTQAPLPTPTPGGIRETPQAARVAALIARGKKLKNNRAWAEAKAVFSEVLELDPFEPTALFERGWVRRSMGDPGGAVLDFDRLLKVRPDHVIGLIERAGAKAAAGDARGAIDDCTRAIWYDSNSYRAFYDRAIWRMRLRPPAAAEALEDLERAVALDPTGDALFDRGMVRHRLKRPGVVDDLRAAISKLRRGSKRYEMAKLVLQAVLQEQKRKEKRGGR